MNFILQNPSLSWKKSSPQSNLVGAKCLSVRESIMIIHKNIRFDMKKISEKHIVYSQKVLLLKKRRTNNISCNNLKDCRVQIQIGCFSEEFCG